MARDFEHQTSPELFTRQADFENLQTIEQGIGSHKQWSFPVEQIQSLDMADSGMKVNGQAWPELQIETIDGKSVNFMAGRKESQIAFVAGVLCRTIFPSRTK